MFSLRPRPRASRNDNRKSLNNSVCDNSEPTDVRGTMMDKPEHADDEFEGSISQSYATRATSFGTSSDCSQSWSNLISKFCKVGGDSSVHTRNIPGLSFDLSTTTPLRRAMQLSGILEDIPADVDHPSSSVTPHSYLSFSRQKVAPCSNQPSALSALLSSPSAPIINPFTNLKASASPDEDSMVVRVYFPHAEDPPGEYIELHVGTEVKVADLMGLALWTYWENAWRPQLSVNHTDTLYDDKAGSSPCTMTALSRWCLRLVRDSFVDYENEAPDVSDKVRLLGAQEFALLNRPDTLTSCRGADPRRKSHLRRFSLPRVSPVKSHKHTREFSLGVNYTVPIKLFYVKTISDEQHASIECSIHATINDVLNVACRKRSIKHPELYRLMTQSVQKVLKAVPGERNVSSFEDNTEFVLAVKTDEDSE